ncbi:P-loop containing nucleoside triphosphate hydrolase protein [Auriculariales sp. MPI-PUGE-AT-0066]|nr:P-loop containing nucleoside triphosphate hydrolase protein [Auriculariales sp. MPI-PUGE-AT-0066]
MAITHAQSLGPPAFVERRYQEEIRHGARDHNIIAVLPTGSGKTFIAANVIRDVTARAVEGGAHHVVLFLAPTTTLVDQQTQFLTAQLPLKVAGYVGKSEIEQWEGPRWRSEFLNHHVLVMTPELLRIHVLSHGYWSMDKVSLIVFDEVHNARGKHPYAQLMRDYVAGLSVGSRPKIFGMTASPVWSPKKPAEDIRQLEERMLATVVAVKEHLNELSLHSHRPRELAYIYPPFPRTHDDIPRIWDSIDAHRNSFPKAEWKRLESKYYAALEAAGVYAAELLAFESLAQLKTKLADLPPATAENTPTTSVQTAGVRQLLDDLSAHSEIFGPTFQVDLGLLSPKLRLLVDVLCDNQTPAFKAIVFVKEQHVAFTLAEFMCRIPDLEWIKAGALVGHTSSKDIETRGMDSKEQQQVVKDFRESTLNLLFCTSVAEEGLDFQACELVVRFDPVPDIKSYLQSRGRARKRDSTFVVLCAELRPEELKMYQTFRESEKELQAQYASAKESAPTQVAADIADDIPASDLQQREPNFVVPSTRATLTYDGAVHMLELLCASLSADEYGVLRAQYTVADAGSLRSFLGKVELPSALPLPREKLCYQAASPRSSKREARNAAAFLAVKELYTLGIFDDNLLPVHYKKTPNGLDAYLRSAEDVSDIPEKLFVDPLLPWAAVQVGQKCRIHAILVDGQPSIGFVAASRIPDAEFSANGKDYKLTCLKSYRISLQEEIEIMTKYTSRLFWVCGLSTKKYDAPFAFYLCAIDATTGRIDWNSMDSFVSQTYSDCPVKTSAASGVLVENSTRPGHVGILREISTGLMMSDAPRELNGACREKNYKSYYEYYQHISDKRSSNDKKWQPPKYDESSPLVLLDFLPKLSTSWYDISSATGLNRPGERKPMYQRYVPVPFCRRINLEVDVAYAVQYLPQLLRRVAELHRVRALGLPLLNPNALIEATTLPHSGIGFDNQRLETLGDAFLKVGVSVYAFEKYPHKHEGQLTNMRIPSVSNRSLLARARNQNLQIYLSGESGSRGLWTPTLAEVVATVEMPRRSMQECVEALLGAAFADGGVEAALDVGRKIGLCFGEETAPWSERYQRRAATPSRALFDELQDMLGYRFSDGTLVLEAVSHRSMQSNDTPSYERLEFLGDALLDLAAIHYLFKKYPTANCGQLSWMRQRVVCNTTLAWIAVKKLGIHKVLLFNNTELSYAIREAVDVLEELDAQTIIRDGWKYDLPKPLSDVVEALFGAIFIDLGRDYDRTAALICGLMNDILEILTPNMTRDPSSRLMLFLGEYGCRQVKFRRLVDDETEKNLSRRQKKFFATITAHGLDIVVPAVSASSKKVAKLFAAEAALSVLQDDNSSYHFVHICDCKLKAEQKRHARAQGAPAETDQIEEKGSSSTVDTRELAPSDETEEGFEQLVQEETAMGATTKQTI